MGARDDYDRLVAERPPLRGNQGGAYPPMHAYADRLEAALAAAVEREERLREALRTIHSLLADCDVELSHELAEASLRKRLLAQIRAIDAALATEEEGPT